MATLLPTAGTMGGVEPFSRFIGHKFLKGGSVHSRRMKYKNAWTMTVLHEVGHTVDNRRDVMENFGERPAFGGWRSHSVDQLADAMLDAYTAAPEVTYEAKDAERIVALTETFERERKVFAEADWDGKDDQYTDRRDFFEKVRRPARDRAAEAEQERDQLVDGVTQRAWRARHGVTRQMLKVGITAAARKKDPSAAVRRAPGYTAMDRVEQATTRRLVEAHPAVKMVQSNYSMGAWQRRDKTMATMARPLGGRYFQRSYPGRGNDVDTASWTSFLVASRKDAVSHYQYRAPGEWFAELYAHYYMGTLEGHPLGLRVLGHPHEDEQPFTRSLGNVEIPEGVNEVVLRVRCTEDGWTTEPYVFTLP